MHTARRRHPALFPAFLPAAALARPARAHAPLRCARRRPPFAQAGPPGGGTGTDSSSTTNPAHLPDPAASPAAHQQPQPPVPQQKVETPAERAERARRARQEAERLELLAAKARLDVERAELAAERNRLELDKVRTLREAQRIADGQARPASGVSETETSAATAAASAAADADAGDAADDSQPSAEETVKNIMKAVQTEPGSPPKINPGALSDLLGADFPRVSERDITTIRERLCGMDTFFITEVDRSPFDERVVFRGNMRMDPNKLLDEIETRAKKEGISERVRLFLLIDPKDSPVDEDDDKRPVLVALPASALPNQTTPFSAVFSVIVALAAFFTTFSYGIGVFGLTPDVISEIAKGNSEQALLTLPISIGVMSLGFVHDLAHRVLAAMRDVELGLPFFIPSLQIGHYGVITPLESYPRLRKDLFDVSVAGPIAGLACSLVALLGGLAATAGGATADWFPQIPSALFHSSLLVGSLADLVLPAGLREQATIAVHPATMVGYTGLLVNALNLMPIGRLDGGRIVQALYGRIVAGRLTAVTLLVQGFGALLGNSPLLLFWGLVCVFLQRESDIPCQNEVMEPDDTRSAIGLTCLVIMLLVLIPFPDQISTVIGNL